MLEFRKMLWNHGLQWEMNVIRDVAFFGSGAAFQPRHTARSIQMLLARFTLIALVATGCSASGTLQTEHANQGRSDGDREMLLDWSVVPQRFHYLNNVVLEDRRDELGIARFDPELNRHVSLAEKLTREEIAGLARVHTEICDREDNAAILDWLAETKGGTQAQVDASWRIRSMLRLLNDLARRGVEPFATEVVVDEKPRPLMADDRDRQTVPEDLVPFLEFVARWGVTTSDTERYSLRERVEADPQQITELQRFVDNWTRELGTVYDEWADRESMSKNEIVAQFYFTFLLIDELGLKPTKVEETDQVAQLISDLKEFGSKRKNSERMWAARGLPDYGDDAKRAIPALQEAIDDPEPGVRIWAHCALARLVGDEPRHREAIRRIGGECAAGFKTEFDREFFQLGVEAALEVLDRTPEQHNLEALGGFCIVGDVREILRLAPITHVDGLNHNGQRPLQCAVGNDKVDAVRILLEHGADPNLRTSQGDSYLHVAAATRDGAPIINLLVEHGADVNAEDEFGWTPLDVASDNDRDGNASLIRSLGGRSGEQ